MELIGRGATAEVYSYGEDKICKLFNLGYPKGAVEKEYKNAILLQNVDLSIPHVYNMVRLEEREGIIYERIYGQDGLEQLKNAENLVPLIKRMTDLHKQILSIHITDCMSYKTYIKQLTWNKEEQASDLLKRLEILPDGDCLCHGDYHPGNLLFQKDGTIKIIDFMNVCYAPREYDIARTYFLLGFGELPPDMPNKDEVQMMRKYIADLYLDNMDCTIDDIKDYFSVVRASRRYEMEE